MIEPGCVVVAVATGGPLREKMLSNVSEVKSRGATVVLVLEDGDDEGAAVADYTLTDSAELVVLDDERLAHGVTPVTPLESGRPSYRDVLVVTFRAVATDAGTPDRGS